ncbi:MAG TPA: cell wall hydrolase [Caulobacteraceae bacterium]|nr:cell wall hydrolase [Caulobacteraceae bacterium]
MTAPRTRPLAALVSFVGLFSAYAAASFGLTQPKAPARHPILIPANALGKAGVPAGAITFALEPDAPARPFVLNASAHDRELAERCLAQAVYYEAGRQPLAGQEAVAQTVLNRLRHPDYPKSVCGVVYEGSQLRTGCQFSFTCDGSLRRTPDPQLWSQATAVAKQALNGFVMTKVGTATYYHADYVRPFWAGALKRITQIGAHIFYRWPGPSGDATAFNGQYAGHETDLSGVLRATDPRLATLRPAVLRHATPYRAPVAEAVQRRDAEPATGGFQVARRSVGDSALHLVEASYVTHGRERVETVLRPVVDRTAATAPAHPIPYAALNPQAAPHALAVATAKVSLPPVHAIVVAAAAPAAAAASAHATPAVAATATR